MGVDYTAYAVIGVRVDPAKLYTKQTVKAFKHDFGSDVLFHPQTGKALWHTEDRPIPEFKDENYGNGGDNKLLGYEVVFGTDRKEAFICATGVRVDSGNGRKSSRRGIFPSWNMDWVRNEMTDALSPLGLWDDAEFGLWAVLYCSY